MRPIGPACLLAALLALPACGPAGDGPAPAAGAGAAIPVLHDLPLPAAAGALAPRLSSSAGEIFLTWLQPAAGAAGHDLMFSRLQGAGAAVRWSEPQVIARGDDFFANWADNPGLRRGDDGALVAYWLARSGPETYAYDVRLARSTDDGRTWQPGGLLHHDGVAGEHGFVSTLGDDGGVRAFWLDGREMTLEGEGGHGGSGNMTLRTALVGELAGADELLDPRVCECCQTAAAQAAAGPVVIYRDRSADEDRDIWIVRRTADGWSEPAPVHVDGWRVPGCPVNGPALAARPAQADHLVAAWFTAAGQRPRVLAAFSIDGGAGFAPPVMVDDAAPLGRVDVTWDGRGGALVLWLGAGEQEGEARLLLRRVTPAGPAGPPHEVAVTATARGSGFPRLAQRGDNLILVWTDPRDGTTRLRGAVVPLADLPEWAAASLPAGAAATTGNPRAAGIPGDGAAAWDGRIGSSVPAYAARDLEGAQVALDDLGGHPVLVNIWATWCMPCREETPALIDLHRRYADSGLQVLGISVDTADDEEQVRRFVRDAGVTYPVLLDPEDRASSLFGLRMLPGSFLFDGQGTLVWSRHGVVAADDPELRTALAALGPAGSR